MKVVIPFKTSNPKSRLSSILNDQERFELALNMLKDVLDSLKKLDVEVKVLSPNKIDLDVEVVEDNRSLNECINDELKEVPKAVIMSDLPLLSPEVLQRFFNSEGEVVIAPGRKGGTNMLLVRKEGFRVSYHYGSFRKHVKIAEELGFKVGIFDSFYASVDVDDEADLLELMLHGEGKRSWEYLKSLGFDVKFSKVPKLVRYNF